MKTAERNEYSLENGVTFCHESFDGFEIEQCKRYEPCSMPLYHYHDSYEIYYLLSGTRNYFIKDRTYRIEKGDLVLINRHDLHKTSYGGSHTHERILVIFDEAFFRSISGPVTDADLLGPFHRNMNLVKLQKAEQAIIEQILFKMIKEAREKDLGYKSYIRLAMVELLLNIARKTAYSKPSAGIQPDQIQWKILEIVKYINANYMEDLTLGSISDKFYISPFYFSRLFKKTTGFTFVEYLNSIRIREAQRLLISSDLNVSEIADKTGYSSSTHFGRVFKEIAGMSPLRFRKINL